MSGEVTRAALDQLYGCLTGWRLTSDIAVASAALIFYDWILTCVDELGFLWRRHERITFARVLFALARYPALACAVVDLLPVRACSYDVSASCYHPVLRA